MTQQQQHPLEIMGGIKTGENTWIFADDPTEGDTPPAGPAPAEPTPDAPTAKSITSAVVTAAEQWQQIFGGEDEISLDLTDVAGRMVAIVEKLAQDQQNQ